MKIKFIGARGICSERAGTEKREKTPNGPKECDWPARARHREARARRSAVASIIQAQRGLTRRHWLTRRSLHLGESLDSSPCCLWGHPSAAFRAPKATQRVQTTNDRLQDKKSFFFQQLCFPHHPFHTHWAVSMPAAPQWSGVGSFSSSCRLLRVSRFFLSPSSRPAPRFLCSSAKGLEGSSSGPRLQTKCFDRHFDDVRADDYSFPTHKQRNVYNCISRPVELLSKTASFTHFCCWLMERGFQMTILVRCNWHPFGCVDRLGVVRGGSLFFLPLGPL